MQEIQTVTDYDKSLKEIDSIKLLSTKLSKTPHYSNMGEAGIFAIALKAKSMNLDLFEALNGALYYVQGRVGMYSETMACMVRRAGHSIIKDSKSTNTNCILKGTRKDNGDTWTVSFSIEDARRAGLTANKSWDKYPSVMCYNRAMAILFRQLFPDLSKNAGYTPDELKEIVVNEALNPADINDEKETNINTYDGEYELSDIPDDNIKFHNYAKITTEQVQEIQQLLRNCSSDYSFKVLAHLKELKPSIAKIEDIPDALYERIKSAAIKNAVNLSEEPIDENAAITNVDDLNKRIFDSAIQ